jgi:uncharacterized FlaG/YvyC family protein
MTVSRVSDITRGIGNPIRAPGASSGEGRDVENISPARVPQSNQGLTNGEGGAPGGKSLKVEKPQTADIKKTVDEINAFMESQKRNISFHVDRKADAMVIRVIKEQTGELIRQIPSQEILSIRMKLREMTGGHIDQTV